MVAVPHPSRLPSRPHVPTNLTIYQQEPLAPKMPTLLKCCALAHATTKTPKWRDLLTSGALPAHAFYRDTHLGQGRNSTRPDMPQEEWVVGCPVRHPSEHIGLYSKPEDGPAYSRSRAVKELRHDNLLIPIHSGAAGWRPPEPRGARAWCGCADLATAWAPRWLQ